MPVHGATCRDSRGLGPSWNVLGHLHFSSCDGLTWYCVMVSLCVLLRKIKWSIFHMYFMAIWILTFVKSYVQDFTLVHFFLLNSWPFSYWLNIVPYMFWLSPVFNVRYKYFYSVAWLYVKFSMHRVSRSVVSKTLCDPMDCSPPGSSVHGILQARILKWVSISSFRGSSWPRDWTHLSYVSCIGRWVLYH